MDPVVSTPHSLYLPGTSPALRGERGEHLADLPLQARPFDTFEITTDRIHGYEGSISYSYLVLPGPSLALFGSIAETGDDDPVGEWGSIGAAEIRPGVVADPLTYFLPNMRCAFRITLSSEQHARIAALPLETGETPKNHRRITLIEDVFYPFQTLLLCESRRQGLRAPLLPPGVTRLIGKMLGASLEAILWPWDWIDDRFRSDSLKELALSFRFIELPPGADD